jgi:hypothetical protein
MIDSKLPAGCEEAARRPPKSGVATATSTRRPRCTPNSTTFSRQLTCWSMTSSPSAEAPAGASGTAQAVLDFGETKAVQVKTPRVIFRCPTPTCHRAALVPALVFPQGSLGYGGAGSPGRAISSVSAMVSLWPASVARVTSSAASEARARSMSSRPTGLSP